jgi:hypothetical protein
MAGIENQLVVFALATYAGLVLFNFLDTVNRRLLLPIFAPVTGEDDKVLMQVGSIKFNVGDLIIHGLNLVFGVVIIYCTLPYLKEYVPIAGRR